MIAKRLLTLLIVPMLMALSASAQIIEPIKWHVSSEMTSDTQGLLKISADIEKGWHLYGFDIPEGGPRPTVIAPVEADGVTFGTVRALTEPTRAVDMIFHLKISFWSEDVKFEIPFTLADGRPVGTDVRISFQGCNDKTCTAPQKLVLPVTLGNAPADSETVAETHPESSTYHDDMVADKAVTGRRDNLWQPVTFPAENATVSVLSSPWWKIFLLGFGGGFLALLTPCVWPMIPMTVSFFLKRNKQRSKAVGDALTYGTAIVAIYLLLGLAITAIFGAGKLNELATNAVFNLAFFALLVVFGISFLGAFDIKLPSSWSNSADSRAESATGFVSIFFMAFTLALVSFSCTGPIIGTLLVEAASEGSITGPAVGMAGFALALALPFTLFALFPSWLKEMPKSGGWLNSVKVVLGFLELALSLKFLSVADLAYGWGVLDREVFVALWIVIFALLGMYLLGKLRFSHDAELAHVGVFRFFLAVASFSMSVYLVPGLWGAPLKGVSAFVPPLYTQDFNLYAGGRFEEFDDFDKAMDYAAECHRPVLVDFSGYGCVNCRKMEGAVFDTSEVEKIIKENFILVKLMVDDKQPLEHPLTVTENGRKVVLETVGDKWSYLQRSKFGANSQPYYVMLDDRAQPLAAPAYYDENLTKFVEWLDAGLKAFASLPD